MKLYLFKNWENPNHPPMNVKASNYNSALTIASAFINEPAYIGEKPL